MRNRSLLPVLAFVTTPWTLMLACNATGPGPTPPITSAILDAGGDAARLDGATSTSTPEDAGAFFACTADTDCVAVPKNSCCDNGYMDAVNKGSVDAYKASFTCATKQVCPMFRINDARIARCATSTHQCELVRPPGSGLPTPR